ncbi:LAME_0E04060g1_1 [Lachancea meyersii CBS 8951]|uniref:LAME_0E04060g1_1 n=1 Tax=Lachancea meyersii CBS 8951 TaxID=1266667 RepID=A0A1G4JHI7_9SACH|nr:LAME_0E04060g1_1 [Lachancea meyersii CBS 8951]
MSTILYNANSKLVSRFHRKVKLRNELNVDFSDEPSFKSSHPKNSPEYLRELCKSVYPESLHSNFTDMAISRLSVHAFFALIVQNFVKTWFGTKIPSTDPEFLCELFAIVQRLVVHVENYEVSWEQLILDDLPLVVFEHFQALKTNGLVYSRENSSSATADYICSLLRSESTLEAVFVRSLYVNLLCGKILHSIAEPYLTLEILNKVARSKLENLHSEPSSIFEKISSTITVVRSALKFHRQGPQQLWRPFTHRYFFTCARRLIRFEQRRPFLYCLCKYTEAAAAKIPGFDRFMYRLFQTNVADKLSSGPQVAHIFVALRQLVFPRDTVTGPPRPVFDDHKKKLLREECEQNFYQLLASYKIESIVGLTVTDVKNFVSTISADQCANAQLLERLVACVIAHIA